MWTIGLLVAGIVAMGAYLVLNSDLSVSGPEFTPRPTQTAAPDASESPDIPVVQPAPNRPDPTSQLAIAALERLPVLERDAWDGYSRQQFGENWQVRDGNGCDARQLVLARDLTETSMRGCDVMRGRFIDPFTGNESVFQRGPETSGLVQIDHVVALADAWQKGAQNLELSERVAFASDPLNLIAASDVANQDKMGKDAANWLPPDPSYRCPYVARQIAVKLKWDFWLSWDEQQAMYQVLESCPQELLPNGQTPG